MSKEHLLQRLQPVDFRAVADRGWFVYCYLRTDCSPFYVGLSKNARRATTKRQGEICPVKDRPELIRVLRSGLSKLDAFFWERFYISHYGRKDLGTGILRNRCDGGEGVSSMGPEGRRKHSKAMALQSELFERSGLPLTKYLRLTNKQRDAMHKYLQRNPEMTGQQWLNGVRDEEGLQKASRLGAQARSAAALEEFVERSGLSYEQAKPLSQRKRSNCLMYLRRNPDSSGLDWLEVQGLPNGLRGAEGAKSAAAKRLGLPETLYCGLPNNVKRAMSKWLREHPESTARFYLSQRGWV